MNSFSSTRVNRDTSTSAPSVGFAGVGWIGRHRMEGMIASGHIRAAGIADPADELACAARELAPEAAVLSTYEELLEQDLAGMVIATPSALHAEQTIRALEKGCAVFCQKPLGRSAAEVRRVVETARSANRLLGVDLSYRFARGLQWMKQRVADGGLGHIYAIHAVFHNAYGPDKEWFYDPRRSGGGCVMDLGIHLVDLLLWMTDFPDVRDVRSRLYAKGQRLREHDRVEDYASVQFELATGANVDLACSWGLPAGCDCAIELSLYGTEGGLSWKNVNGSFYDFITCRLNGTACEVVDEPPDEWGVRAAVDWAHRLSRSAVYDPQIEENIQVAEVLDEIYACNRRD